MLNELQGDSQHPIDKILSLKPMPIQNHKVTQWDFVLFLVRPQIPFLNRPCIEENKA